MERRYLIAEDEPLLARQLHRSLTEAWPHAVCAGVVSDGDEALREINMHRPDVVFLDIRMPGRDGLQTARELCTRTDPPLIVFVTAYEEHAVAAFETEAIDYLLKPLEPERLMRCIERIQQRLEHGGRTPPAELLRRLQSLLTQVPSPYLRFVRAGAGDTVRMIPLEDVLWFKADDKYVTVATAKGDSVIRSPLRQLLQRLDPQVFWQVHRGTVVNARFIVAAKRDELGRVELVMGERHERILVSRQFVHLFRQM